MDVIRNVKTPHSFRSQKSISRSMSITVNHRHQHSGWDQLPSIICENAPHAHFPSLTKCEEFWIIFSRDSFSPEPQKNCSRWRNPLAASNRLSANVVEENSWSWAKKNDKRLQLIGSFEGLSGLETFLGRSRTDFFVFWLLLDGCCAQLGSFEKRCELRPWILLLSVNQRSITVKHFNLRMPLCV